MDLLSKLNQSAQALPIATNQPQVTITGMVNQLLHRQSELWWTCEQQKPAFYAAYTTSEQAANEKKLARLCDGLVYELNHLPKGPEERRAWEERLRPGLYDFAHTALNLEQRHLDFIEASGMLEASLTFARMARRFDPKISGEDIYQAGRNVMTANFMQLLLGLPVEVTPAIFAYSMLYPYTDNYLDDPAVSGTTKLAFNHRFQLRLMGETIRPANQHEAVISDLVSLIEGQWDRARFPLVYESLLAIHMAQARSLKLVAPEASPFELDVVGISFEKGGTSVLADGYLVAGWLSQEQAALMFGYGAFTQLMDDLEDIQTDLKDGRLTVFTQTAGHWPLDRLTNKLFHFSRAIFSDLSAFPSQAASVLGELIERAIDPILLDIIGRTGKYYSRSYLRDVEHHMAFRFDSVRKQREKLTRKRIDTGRLIDLFLSA